LTEPTNGTDNGEREIIFPLLSDEPSEIDLLSFDAVAMAVVDAICDDKLDPVAIGVSGSWGSGKTTVLELVKAEIDRRANDSPKKVLVVPVDPWRFDPAVGPKESLIAAVLAELSGEIKDTEDAGDVAVNIVKRLAKRVNWSKAIKMAATTAITLQLPSIDDLPDLIKEGDPDSLDGARGLDEFRSEFAELLQSDGLAHISRVVVLVDDLDRCLPPTVVDSLEAIRLFLSAKGMSFVIAADEQRVADAIQHKLQMPQPKPGQEAESVAELYLHKIVQTTIPLPALSRIDTQSYLFLLLCREGMDTAAYEDLVLACADLRTTSGSLDDLVTPEGVEVEEYLSTAARLTPIVYEKLHGNPRRIKRFLNDLSVRQKIAEQRGITLKSSATAKLMVLERLLPEEFNKVLEWLSQNELRDKLNALEAESRTAATDARADSDGEVAVAEGPDGSKPSFDDRLVRWAKLPPELDATDVSGYLYLAASFANVPLLEEGLPERLRDIAAALMSTSKIDRASIKDTELQALSTEDTHLLITYLARRTRDQPSLQKFTVTAILRLVSLQSGIEDSAVTALKLLPTKDLEPVTPLKFRNLDASLYRALLEHWLAGDLRDQTRQAIEGILSGWGA
jgi:hypothetical protein